MAATVTLDKVLALAAKLTADEQKRLVDEVKVRQRKRAAWERQLAKDAKQGLADSKAGKLKRFSSVRELMADLNARSNFPDLTTRDAVCVQRRHARRSLLTSISPLKKQPTTQINNPTTLHVSTI
jgi:hypothetical protein